MSFHAQAVNVCQWFNVTSIVYNPAVLFTKIAIILFYRRIFSPQHRSAFDIGLRVFVIILCCFYIATGVVKIWECNPRARIWDKSIPGTCLNAAVVLDTSGLYNVLTDVIILLVPVKAVWSMHLAPRRKVGVIGVFTLGLTYLPSPPSAQLTGLSKMLGEYSAPVFSIIGSVVRLKVSSSPDMTHHQPVIQLWA